MASTAVPPPTSAPNTDNGAPTESQNTEQQQQQQEQTPSTTQASGSVTPPVPSGSLYVGELDPTVTEAMLFEVFNMIGPVASIRVCRDAITRRSLGYSYVNFHSSDDAERAIDSLNYSLIKGRPCRIMWSQRDPALRKTGNGNIFIKNLDPQIDNKALHDTFSAFGNILSCKIALDETGQSKGYGFVHYETEEAAEMAIQKVNGMLLNDRKVFVGHHVSRKERQAKFDELKANFTNVYVKNIDGLVSDEELGNHFRKYGPVTSVAIAKDDQGVSRGFGFVNFENHEDARKAVEALNDTDFNGRTLYVSRAQKKNEREQELRRQYEQARMEKLSKYQGVNLYVKNLDDDIDDERLRQEFAVYGVITSAKVMRDDTTGVSRGFGFVCFSEADEATRAITEANGRMLGSKPIYVALAQRKDVRRQQLEAQMAHRSNMRMGGPPGGVPPPAGYMQPGMFYPPGPGGFVPGPGQRPPMFPQGGMMPPRPRWQQGQPPMPHPGQGGGRPNRPPRQPRKNNPPAPAPEQQQQAQQSQQPEGLTAEGLAAVPSEQQKQMLGERLYPLIHQEQPEYAGKITGMLLEMDNNELLRLLNNKEALDGKIGEAMEVLKQHFDSAQDAAQ
ncbi:hypothetical protein INT45_011104 [Circinella minor]|uniref:Polyadenylate-binding protein n=1 Tax=Circinella minor TaxID=1195481 RepID=A0A8H7SHL9_9FUNG|nr:hypothetical protein INT45_011104 [Circinella minor]